MDQRTKSLLLAGTLALFTYSIISIINQAPNP
jgi:hypothetical protein